MIENKIENKYQRRMQRNEKKIKELTNISINREEIKKFTNDKPRTTESLILTSLVIEILLKKLEIEECYYKELKQIVELTGKDAKFIFTRQNIENYIEKIMELI